MNSVKNNDGQSRKIRDLICWQKARQLVMTIYDMSRRGPLSRGYELSGQMRGVAISSMSNIAEGFCRYHKKELVRFLDISQSSAAEVKSLLYVLLDQAYASSRQVKGIQELADETRQVTLGLLTYVGSSMVGKPNSIRELDATYKGAGQSELVGSPGEFICAENSS